MSNKSNAVLLFTMISVVTSFHVNGKQKGNASSKGDTVLIDESDWLKQNIDISEIEPDPYEFLHAMGVITPILGDNSELEGVIKIRRISSRLRRIGFFRIGAAKEYYIDNLEIECFQTDDMDKIMKQAMSVVSVWSKRDNFQ